MSAELVNLTLGTAGHIDHGKTALVGNLTGCDTDRLKEEKERGLSIELGFAPLKLGTRRISIVDVPGHERFVRTMVAGATGIDAVLVVVAADDGVMPQTREHLDILTLLGTRAGVVAVTKCDLVSSEQLEHVVHDVRELLVDTFLGDAPVVAVSNKTGQGLSDLLTALQTMVEQLEPRRCDGVFRLPVERAFSVPGRGTVVTGIPVSGSIGVGDEVVVLPAGATGRAVGLEVFKRSAQRGGVGQCVALNVRQWDHREIERGHVVSVDGYFTAAMWYLCELRLLADRRLNLKNASAVRLHTGTADIPATIYLTQGSSLEAGQESLVQIRMDVPLVAGRGDRFILRRSSPIETIGGGVIVDALRRRVRCSRPEQRAELERRARCAADDLRFADYCLAEAGATGADPKGLAFRLKIQPDQVDVLLKKLCEQNTVRKLMDRYVHTNVLEKLAERLLAEVRQEHTRSPVRPSIPMSALWNPAPAPRPVFEAALAMLVEGGRLRIDGSQVASAEHRARASQAEERLLKGIEALFAERSFNPPSADEAAQILRAPVAETKKTLQLLCEQGRLVRVAPDMLFAREAIDRAQALIKDAIRREGRLASVDFKYLLDTSRKYALPLLDYFDRIGMTSRSGDNTRYLRVDAP